MGRPGELTLDRRVLAVAAAAFVLLLAVSGRYGYHRDELYFLTAGRHLAWGYPDQPGFVPLVARAMSALASTSLPLLRLPSALAIAAVIVLTGDLARRLGADRAGQLLAAACAAMSPVFLGLGHQLSTATFSLLAWTALLWLFVRILAGGDKRLWVVAGAVAGVGLDDSSLVAFLLLAVAVGVAVSGPRRDVFGSPWMGAGAVVASALWAPYLVWQARHGWPQLAVSRAIAAGESGSSQPRALFLPFQLLQVGWWLAPVWVTGLWRLLRDPALRWARPLGWIWPVLVVVFVATGGKPYYLSGVYPLLFAAGAGPSVGWLCRRGRPRALVSVAIALAAVAAVIALPLLPQRTFARSHLVAVNYDLGEQIAWPAYVREIARAYSTVPPGTTIVTRNYGEAGAVDHYGPPLGLPHAYSGQTGYWDWGPPPETPSTLVVGFDPSFLRRFFGRCDAVAKLHNDIGVDNDEQGTPLWLCARRDTAWRQIWPAFKRT